MPQAQTHETTKETKTGQYHRASSPGMFMKSIKPGTVIGGCEIESLIAKGGMGAVYLARQMLLDRPVAVKVMSPRLLKDPRTIKNFLMEGKVMAKLDHPSIVRVYSTVEENGLYFLVMEYAEGKNLKDLVSEEGPLTARKALSIVREVAKVLAFAHDHGIIHLDIKPPNIILTASGQVKVTDFGISHIMKQSGHVALSGHVIGTPAYMSPEQCRGEKVSGTSDIYSLGATLYTLLSGRLPFKGRKGHEVIEKVINSPPPALELLAPNLPEKVIGLVQRMMAKDPQVRYQGGNEVAGVVDTILAGDMYDSATPRSWLRRPILRGLSWWHVASAFFVLWFLGLVYWGVSPDMWATSGAGPAATGGEGPGDQQGTQEPEQPSDPGGSRDAGGTLDARLETFQGLLVSGRAEDMLTLVHPEKRDLPEAKTFVVDIVEVARRKGVPEQGTFETVFQGAEQATVLLHLPSHTGDAPIVLPLRWSHRSDGRWYLEPDLLR
jgi:serine/threonine-protein kinase